MGVDDEDPLASHREVRQRSCIQIEVSSTSLSYEPEVDIPYCFFQTSNSFHGVLDSWKRLPKNGIPLGPGGNFPLARLLTVLIV